jgi:hypothetical protein
MTEQLAFGFGPEDSERRRIVAERLRELELDEMFPTDDDEGDE